MKISVAMAAYNGESYILEQLASILNQLGEEDEVIVSVDPCKDNTLNVVKALAELDSRVKPVEGEGKGLIKNFENAIDHCTGDIIFLSDQDDYWVEDKVETVMRDFVERQADLVLHNCSVVDGFLNPIDGAQDFFGQHGSRPGYIKNIIKNSYMGCCMAFRKELVREFMPFPENLPMHDQWIGLIAERCGAVIVFEDKPLLLYRRHGGNVSATQHASLPKMIRWRWRMLQALKAFPSADEKGEKQ
ncbi:MAG: glycosyltransferase family 2 protein [Ruminococcaceae bacterium]|nr:glycosyltransferase family 2 protein [Oscillospiraceae bacterium]